MAKQGMKRPEVSHTKHRNEVDPVPEIDGKSTQSKAKAEPPAIETEGADLEVFQTEHPSPGQVYSAMESDLAKANLENDLSAADAQDS